MLRLSISSYVNLRWRTGYQAVANTSTRLAGILDGELGQYDQLLPDRVQLLVTELPQIGVLASLLSRVWLAPEERHGLFQHSVLLGGQETIDDGLIQAAFRVLYGPNPDELIDALYNMVSTLEYSQGRPFVARLFLAPEHLISLEPRVPLAREVVDALAYKWPHLETFRPAPDPVRISSLRVDPRAPERIPTPPSLPLASPPPPAEDLPTRSFVLTEAPATAQIPLLETAPPVRVGARRPPRLRGDAPHPTPRSGSLRTSGKFPARRGVTIPAAALLEMSTRGATAPLELGATQESPITDSTERIAPLIRLDAPSEREPAAPIPEPRALPPAPPSEASTGEPCSPVRDAEAPSAEAPGPEGSYAPDLNTDDPCTEDPPTTLNFAPEIELGHLSAPEEPTLPMPSGLPLTGECELHLGLYDEETVELPDPTPPVAAAPEPAPPAPPAEPIAEEIELEASGWHPAWWLLLGVALMVVLGIGIVLGVKVREALSAAPRVVTPTAIAKPAASVQTAAPPGEAVSDKPESTGDLPVGGTREAPGHAAPEVPSSPNSRAPRQLQKTTHEGVADPSVSLVDLSTYDPGIGYTLRFRLQGDCQSVEPNWQRGDGGAPQYAESITPDSNGRGSCRLGTSTSTTCKIPDHLVPPAPAQKWSVKPASITWHCCNAVPQGDRKCLRITQVTYANGAPTN